MKVEIIYQRDSRGEKQLQICFSPLLTSSYLPNVYLVTPSNAIVYNKRGDISNFPDVLIGFPEKNGPPKNKVGSSFMKIIAAKKRINAFNRCNKNNI